MRGASGTRPEAGCRISELELFQAMVHSRHSQKPPGPIDAADTPDQLRDADHDVLRRQPGRLSRIPEIASAYSVSELFLFKILQPLVEQGWWRRCAAAMAAFGWPGRRTRSRCSTSCASPKRASPWRNASKTTRADCPLVDSCALNCRASRGAQRLLRRAFGYTIDDLVSERPNMRTLLGIDLLKRPALAG